MHHVVILPTKTFTNWVMSPREMKNSCRSCTGTHLSLSFRAIAPGGTVVPLVTVLHYQIKGLLSSPASVTFLY